MQQSHPSSPSQTVIKRLFAHSGNRCGFPRCTAALVQGDTVVGEICHIKAASSNGPRFDPHQSAEERHSYSNLILLCANHHTIIDDDPEAYTVERLARMKSEHESRGQALRDDEIERGSRLLVDQSVNITNQSGGITAHTVHQTINIQVPTVQVGSIEGRQAVIDRAREFHRSRVAQVASGSSPIALLDGGAFVLHLVPFSAVEGRPATSFNEISGSPHRFPPIARDRAESCRIDHTGMLIGSNADGLMKPQRAYVKVFRSCAIESVASSLARGRDGKFLVLPEIQAWIIKYTSWYARSLNSFGLEPPTAVLFSLINVQGMRLLQDHFENSFLEDMPFARLDDDKAEFDHVTLECTPSGYAECAKMLMPMLSHLAHASGLPSPPYFDADGNYTARLR